MKAPALNEEQFVTDSNGKRVAVLLDLKTYDRLREAEEALADVRAYDVARPKIAAEILARQFSTLAEYRTRRTKSK